MTCRVYQTGLRPAVIKAFRKHAVRLVRLRVTDDSCWGNRVARREWTVGKGKAPFEQIERVCAGVVEQCTGGPRQLTDAYVSFERGRVHHPNTITAVVPLHLGCTVWFPSAPPVNELRVGDVLVVDERWEMKDDIRGMLVLNYDCDYGCTELLLVAEAAESLVDSVRCG